MPLHNPPQQAKELKQDRIPEFVMISQPNMNPSTSESLRLVLPESRTEVYVQDCRAIVEQSAYIRLQANLQKQAATGVNQPIALNLHGIDFKETLQICLAWALFPNPETYLYFLPDLNAGKPETLLSRHIQYFYTLVELYRVASKLVMKELMNQILTSFNIDSFHEPTLMQRFPENFFTSRRAPSYGMLGYYLSCWLDVVHKDFLHLLTLEQAEPLLDVMEILKDDLQVHRARANMEHKQNIKEMGEAWCIDPSDDLPHRFTVFPSWYAESQSNATRGRKTNVEDAEMTDVF